MGERVSEPKISKEYDAGAESCIDAWPRFLLQLQPLLLANAMQMQRISFTSTIAVQTR